MTDAVQDMPPPRTWPALLWVLAGVVAFIVAQLLGLIVYIVWAHIFASAHAVSINRIAHDGLAISISTIVSAPMTLLFLILFARIRTRAVKDYLGLQLFSTRQFFVGAAGVGALLLALTILTQQFDDPRATEFMRDIFVSARSEGAIALLAIAISIAAPVSEEVVFRGFLYKTIEIRFGGIVAILATAIGWAVLHVQYSLISMVAIFGLGLFLGWLRRYSNSILLTAILHGCWNGAALAGSAWQFSGH